MHFQTLVKDDVRQIQFKIHLPPIPDVHIENS